MAQAELPTVRIATPADEADVMAMCKRLWSENGIFSFDDEKVRKLLHRCFNRQGTIVGVIGEPGHIEASTCLGIGDFYYTGDWHLEEFWNFVDVEYRKSKNADALIEFAKRCSDEMGIPLFTGVITAKQMAGKVRLYRRRLGHPIGAYFLYGASLHLTPQVSEAVDGGYGDLKKRIAEFLMGFSDRSVPHRVTKEQLVPLLRDVMAAIKKMSEDDFWVADVASASKHTNVNGTAA